MTYSERVREPGVEQEVQSPDGGASSDARSSSLIQRARNREELRYLVVAGSTTVGYLAILAGLLTTRLPYMAGILVAQVMVISVAFPVYRKLIFRSTGPWGSDLPRFIGVWSGGFIAGIVATPALVELGGWQPLPAQVIAAAVVSVLSYLGHKFVSFGR